MKTATKLWLILGALMLLTPVGLIAKGTAWGEWSSAELRNRHGIVPEGLARLEQLWSALFAGYAMPGWAAGWRAGAGYLLCAGLGCGIAAAAAGLLGKWLAARRAKR